MRKSPSFCQDNAKEDADANDNATTNFFVPSKEELKVKYS